MTAPLDLTVAITTVCVEHIEQDPDRADMPAAAIVTEVRKQVDTADIDRLVEHGDMDPDLAAAYHAVLTAPADALHAHLA